MRLVVAESDEATLYVRIQDIVQVSVAAVVANVETAIPPEIWSLDVESLRLPHATYVEVVTSRINHVIVVGLSLVTLAVNW